MWILSISLVIAATVVVLTTKACYGVIKKFCRNDKLLRKVPGPRPTPFFGNVLDFLFLPPTQYLNVMMKYAESYGECIKVYDGPFSVSLLISDPKLLKFFLSSDSKLKKSEEYEYYHRWLGTGLFTSEGTKWKMRRKMLTPSFHVSLLDKSVDIIESVLDVFISVLEKEVGKDSVDIYPLVNLLLLDIICEAAMGTNVNAQKNKDNEYVKSVKVMLQIVIHRMCTPWLKLIYPLTPTYYAERKAVKVLDAYTNSVIDKKIKELQNKPKPENVDNGIGIKKRMVFLDTLLQCTVDGKPLSREDLREEVATFMFGGYDTMSSSLPFTLYSLAASPEIQEKVIKEQIDIFGPGWKSAKSTPQHIQDMKYLDLVIKESLRLYPPGGTISRELLQDIEFEGVTYPEGLKLWIVWYISHRNPKYFEDPDKFIPERFERIEDQVPFSYLPFSAGPRSCIGQKFAMMAMKCIISRVIRNFELLPSTPEHTLQLMPLIILVSSNGVNISLRRRD